MKQNQYSSIDSLNDDEEIDHLKFNKTGMSTQQNKSGLNDKFRK